MLLLDLVHIRRMAYAMVLSFVVPDANAAWMEAPVGTVAYVRSYQDGATGLRAEIAVSGGDHSCGTQPNIYYFDSSSIPLEEVKAIIALSMGAMIAGKSIQMLYDCSLKGGGYGWGVGAKVF